MVTFTLSVILIPYAIIVLLALILSIITAYHLVHYGATTRISFVVTFAFFAGTTLLLFFTWTALRNVNWSEPVTVGPSVPPADSSLF